MEPGIGQGDFAVRNPFGFLFGLKAGDVVVLRHPRENRVLIKRIQKMRPGYAWVEGDNTKDSTDSRNFGWVAEKYILGKTWLVKRA